MQFSFLLLVKIYIFKQESGKQTLVTSTRANKAPPLRLNLTSQQNPASWGLYRKLTNPSCSGHTCKTSLCQQVLYRIRSGCQSSESESRSVLSDSLQSNGLCSPWNSPGQNTGVGSLSLLQGISPTQGSNPGLPHCRQILYQLGLQWSPYKWPTLISKIHE